MERIAVYNIDAGPAQLEEAFRRGKVPPELYDPFQSLIQRITTAASAAPVAVAVSSEERCAHTRDFFAYALARVLLQHLPSTLLVDCDFHDTGLHGVVPQRDALGFLDLLLYGSSLGVITQETTGAVRVVGAGSFPVTKRMPFVMGAFEDAARRLLTHSRCVVFVGPARDDEGRVHPIVPAVDIPLLVRDTGAGSQGVIDPFEEEVAAGLDTELLSVRVNAGTPAGAVPPVEPGFPEPVTAAPEAPAPEPPAPEPPAPAPAAPEVPEPAFAELPDAALAPDAETGFEQLEETPPDAPVPEAAPKRSGPDTEVPVDIEADAIPFDEPRYAAVVPRIVVAVVGVTIIAFIVWWMSAGRPGSPLDLFGDSGTQTDPGPTVAVVDTAIVPTDTARVAEPPDATGDATAVETAPPPPGDDAETAGTTPAVDPADTRGRTGGTVLIGSEDILVMDDLVREWGDWFMVHISSFRTSIKARDEIVYLESREFPVFIVFLDLGAKGKWYRVYSGPFRTREEASAVKKNLDDLSRVRFTRISKVGR